MKSKTIKGRLAGEGQEGVLNPAQIKDNPVVILTKVSCARTNRGRNMCGLISPVKTTVDTNNNAIILEVRAVHVGSR